MYNEPAKKHTQYRSYGKRQPGHRYNIFAKQQHNNYQAGNGKKNNEDEYHPFSTIFLRGNMF